MAPTSPRRIAGRMLVTAALLAGCSSSPTPQTDVADATATPSPSGAPAVASAPDLSDATIDCTRVDGPCDRGDDAELDRLWDACAAGDGTACDRLYYDSGFDTRYEQFGNTCGDRDELVPCPRQLAP